MYFKSIPLSFEVISMFCIYTYGEAQQTFLSQSVTSQAIVTQSVTSQTAGASSTATTTSTPDEITQSIDIALNGRIFPPSIFAADANIPQDFSVDCVDCGIKGNLSLSAGGSIAGDRISTPSDVTKIPSNFNFTDYWIGATFDSFDANFEVGINLNASKPENPLTIPINSTTISRTFDFLTLTATINTELHGWVNTTGNVNFTYGFNFSVPPGSEILVDLKNINESLSLGFNETKLEPIPFNATTNDADVAIELSFRPSVTFIASIGALDAKADLQAAVTLDVPKLDLDVKQIHNVDSTCNPATPSLPADQIYPNLTHIVPSIGFDAFEVLTVEGKLPGLDAQANVRFSQSSSKDLATACYFFDQAQKTLGPAPVTKPSNLSSAAGNRIPVVAIFVATLIAVLVGL